MPRRPAAKKVETTTGEQLSSTVGQKGECLAVHSQKSKTRRWLCSSFSAEREVLDVQEERVYRTRPSEGDWSVPRRALAMPRGTVAKMLPLKSKRMGVRVRLTRECSEALSEERAEEAGMCPFRHEVCASRSPRARTVVD